MVVFGAIVKKPQIRVVMSDLNDRVRAVFDRCSESPRPARCGAGPRFVPVDPDKPRPTSEHQPPAGRDRTSRRPLVAASALDDSRLDSAKLRGRSASATHTDRRVAAFDPLLNIQDANVPLPHVQGVADAEELLLPVQLELVKRFRPRLPPEATNFLTVYTNDVAQIAVPPENRAEHVVKLAERQVIGDRDQADDHRAHLAQNRSQNQAFEGGCFNHLSRLLGSRPPTFWRSPSWRERQKVGGRNIAG